MAVDGHRTLIFNVLYFLIIIETFDNESIYADREFFHSFEFYSLNSFYF